MDLTVERVGVSDVPWDELDHRPDRTVFQTSAWLAVLEETQRAEPVVARLSEAGTGIGWFTGAIVTRGPVRILGSPLRGWTTASMGFVLDRPDGSVSIADAASAVRRFAFRRLGCLHVEIMDPRLPPIAGDGFTAGALPGYVLDLRRGGLPIGDDDLLAGMRPYGRRDVRRGLRNGVTVREVLPEESGPFVEEYYRQVSEAFAKRGRRPTYSASRVSAVVRHLAPTGNLVLLEARSPDGTPAATGLFPGLPGSTAVFWMGAGRRSEQHLLANEVLMWTALRIWRDRGAVRFDFGGGGRYKAKYGGRPTVVPWWRASRVVGVELARALVAGAARRRTRLRTGSGSLHVH